MAQGAETARTINDHLDASCLDAPETAVVSASSSKLAPVFNSIAKPDPPTASYSKRRTQADPTPGFSGSPSGKKRKTTAAATTTISSRLREAAPLAERLRPSSLDDFVGQTHLTGPNSLLLSLVLSAGTSGSVIFWGPPGCGKTTLARLLARRSNAAFKELSATVAGINDVRPIFEEAKNLLQLTGRRTVIFLDEIHRFTKSQQDIFLPYLEQGYVQLIGATTENPSFKINGALLSRCRVFTLERLSDDELLQILTRALSRSSCVEARSEPSSSQTSQMDPFNPSAQAYSDQESVCADEASLRFPHITNRILKSIASLSAGDARTALSLLELVLVSAANTSEDELLASLRRSVSTSYDRTGDDHYDLISALHKSVRGSQPDAALYWLARMLEGGEDPVYICRRMVVCASEDIGLADNHALPLATATMQACQQIGMPECRINLAHLVAYLAEAPKSTRSYEAYNKAVAAARQDMTVPVPLSMRNAPTQMMKEMGYSKDYMYNPDFAHPVTNEYMPEQLQGSVFLRADADTSGKVWDEAALKTWEKAENGGIAWDGRWPGTGLRKDARDDSSTAQ